MNMTIMVGPRPARVPGPVERVEGTKDLLAPQEALLT